MDSTPLKPMLIKVKVLAEDKEETVIKKSADSFIVKVREKRERGEANRKVNLLLARYFGVVSGRVKLIRGGKQPGKIFEIVTI